ncbi:DUF2269 family protein [Georgenia yuyongxinii]|nr:DUF2269 family protein [Georgenia yuyongxinii]
MQESLVQVHTVAAVVFVVFHAVSAVTLLRVRRQRDPVTVRKMLRVSRVATVPADLALLTVLVAGTWAGIITGAFTGGRLWLWAAVAVLVVVLVAMLTLVSPNVEKWRRLVDEKADPPPPDELATALSARAPLAGGAVGLVGLVAIVWLMVTQPF